MSPRRDHNCGDLDRVPEKKNDISKNNNNSAVQ